MRIETETVEVWRLTTSEAEVLREALQLYAATNPLARQMLGVQPMALSGGSDVVLAPVSTPAKSKKQSKADAKKEAERMGAMWGSTVGAVHEGADDEP